MRARGALRIAAGLLMVGGLLVCGSGCGDDPVSSSNDQPPVPALRIEGKTGHGYLGETQGRVTYVNVDVVGRFLHFDGYRILIGYDERYFEVVSVESGNWTEWQQLDSAVSLEYEVYSHAKYDNLGMIRVEGSAPRKIGARSSAISWVRAEDTVQTLCRIGFMVDDDRTLQCRWFPFSFAWESCDDNVLLPYFGGGPRIVSEIYDFYAGVSRWVDPYKGQLRRSASGHLPIFFPPDCRRTFNALGVGPGTIEIRNGGIQTMCWKTAWAGDLDGDFEFFESSDLALFTLGLLSEDKVTALAKALGGGKWPEYEAGGAISSTDVDDDGYPFTLWDYYLFVLTMQESPECYRENRQYARGGEVRFSVHRDIVRVSAADSLGAVMLTFRGKAEPELLAPNCEMQYRYDGGKARVLLRPYTTSCAPHIPSGQLVRFARGVFMEGEAVLRALPRSSGD